MTTVFPFPSLAADTTAVVLVHGMLAGPSSMQAIERHLSRLGHQVINWSYPTLRSPIANHAISLRRLLERLEEDPVVSCVHFVTHSMGGLVVRAALAEPLAKPSRLVMLAPPNRGSWLTRIPLGPLKWWCPPLVDLHEGSDSYVNRLPLPSDLEIGVIAAANDLIVRIESTQLAVDHERHVIASGHNALPKHPEAIRCVINFLSGGTFSVTASMARAA